MEEPYLSSRSCHRQRFFDSASMFAEGPNAKYINQSAKRSKKNTGK
jgi:hypothetical protein